MDAFTPAQTTELMSRIGAKKGKMRIDKLFINSVLGGAFLSFGAALCLTTEAAPWFQTNAPGLIKTIGAFFFPVGLTMIVLSGADLITSNIMFLATALIHRRTTVWALSVNWFVCFFGNLAGSLFYVAILTGYAGTFDAPIYRNWAISFATTKAITPEWHQIFLRGIGCNWLVCLAVFLSISAREVVSKVFAIWIPVLTFVALSFDHVVANMFFIPLAIFLGHPDLTVGYYIWKSLIPSLIGNIVGGVLFTSVPYWYLYLTGPEGVKIHFDLDPAEIATEENAGPTGRRGTSATVRVNESGDSTPSEQLPDSKSNARSGLAEDLDAQKYGKTKALDSAA